MTSMATPTPHLHWYQFRLRSLLLLMAVLAVLSAIGVQTDWSLAVSLAAGGVMGKVFGKSWLGLIYGVGLGSFCAVMAGHLACNALGWSFLRAQLGLPMVKFFMILGSVVGGGLGGLFAIYYARALEINPIGRKGRSFHGKRL